MHQQEDTAADRIIVSEHDSNALLHGDALRAIRARMASLRMPSHKFCAIIAE